MGWGWLFGTLMVVGLIVLVVAIVLMLVRTVNSGRGVQTTPAAHDAGRTPREILDERYARGELNTEEYRERIQVLSSDS